MTTADVVRKARPGKTAPTGDRSFLVVDCLQPFEQEETDPFLLLHAFGPTQISAMPPLGMHPHRGFNECPYLKKGRWLATDPWNMDAEGEDAIFAEGQLQWGKCAGGIEHGMKFDSNYSGAVMGFQLWVNLQADKKLDPPVFQNARADALPVLEPAPKVKAKLLVGSLHGAASPVDTQGIRCQYVDYMLEAGAEVTHPRLEGMSALFVYVYEGAGEFGGSKVSAAAGEVMNFGASGDVVLKATDGGLGVLLLAGAPLREPVVQHGPFVMSSRAQIMKAFEDYQSGRFLHEECTYVLHTASGTSETKRGIEDKYRRQR